MVYTVLPLKQEEPTMLTPAPAWQERGQVPTQTLRLGQGVWLGPAVKSRGNREASRLPGPWPGSVTEILF